jgi:hypothetical protein
LSERRPATRDGAALGPRPVARAAVAVAARPPGELAELAAVWIGQMAETRARAPGAPRANGANGSTAGLAAPREAHAGALVQRIAALMAEPGVVEARVSSLGRRLGAIVDVLLRHPGFQAGWEELAASRGLAHLSSYDLEASVAALERRALAVAARETHGAHGVHGARRVALPVEVAEALLAARRARARGLVDVLSLKGWLDRLCERGERAGRTSPQHVRQMYKMYARESAAVARIERLPDGLRGLVQRAVLECGGLLPRQVFERMESEVPHWSGRHWQLVLENSLVGTVQQLELSRFGIQLNDEVLIVFQEVALAWLRRVAVPSDPDRPWEESSLGIDQISNLARFLSFVREHDVRFTVRGEIFKTTEKKILQQLIPEPGRELSREAALAFLYGFCRQSGLIDRTGERTLAVTPRGREWGEQSLADKLEQLLAYAVEEREVGGEPFHQHRLRENYLRFLRRVEPLVWYDLMYLPFLARNHYLASLHEHSAEEFFASRAQAEHAAPLEDPLRMAWNLARWVRQRLFVLGVVDLGYDRAGRPVAMRLTRVGARLLGTRPDAPSGADGTHRGAHASHAAHAAHAPHANDCAVPAVGRLIVTPDYEVVVFRGGDDADLLHDLDRFCARERDGTVRHLRIGEATVRRALQGGMHLARILEVLQSNARAPLPQNVCYSIQSWAQAAGLMTLGPDLVVRCGDSDALRRFVQDPGVRHLVRGLLDERSVALKSRSTPRRVQALLRDLGYLVEIA